MSIFLFIFGERVFDVMLFHDLGRSWQGQGFAECAFFGLVNYSQVWEYILGSV